MVYKGLALLANSMHSTNGLLLNGYIQDRLDQKHMARIDKGKARCLALGMEQKDMYTGIEMEPLDGVAPSMSPESNGFDLVVGKSPGNDVQNTVKLGKDEILLQWVDASEMLNVADD